MKIMIQKLNEIIKLTTIVAGSIVLALIVFGLISIGVDWSGAGLGNSLGNGFMNFFEMFNISKWSSVSNSYLILAHMLTISFVLIGLITSIAWFLLAIFRPNRKFGLIGGTISLVFSVFGGMLIANLVADFGNSLDARKSLSFITFILLVLAIFVMSYLFFLSVTHLFKRDEASSNSVLEETIITERTPSDVTVIVNNYHEKEHGFDYISATSQRRKTFVQLLAESDQNVKDIYNELKADFLSYGIKSRISRSGDTFRLYTKTYAKIRIVGKGFRVYYALNPQAYADTSIPFRDSGHFKLYADIPLTFRVKSNLSIRRAKNLIRDACAVRVDDELVKKEVVYLDYVKDAIDNHWNCDDESDGNIV